MYRYSSLQRKLIKKRTGGRNFVQNHDFLFILASSLFYDDHSYWKQQLQCDITIYCIPNNCIESPRM